MSLLVLLYKAHTLFFLFWFLATTAHHTGWLLPQPSVFQKISEFFPLYLIQPQVPLSISSLQTPSHCVYLTVSFDILIFYQTLRLPFPSFWQCFVSSSDLLSTVLSSYAIVKVCKYNIVTIQSSKVLCIVPHFSLRYRIHLLALSSFESKQTQPCHRHRESALSLLLTFPSLDCASPNAHFLQIALPYLMFRK